jgi:hypothetical protein
MLCPSCGMQNPEGAKFCAKCGTALQAKAAQPELAGSPTQPVPVQPAAKPAGNPKEPIPGVPGQTQFFMAAAGVSTGAKIRRLVIFILVIVAICVLVILGIRFTQEQARKREAAAKQQQETEAAQQQAPAQAAPEAPAPATPSATNK